jgi:hypothetical protein
VGVNLVRQDEQRTASPTSVSETLPILPHVGLGQTILIGMGTGWVVLAWLANSILSWPTTQVPMQKPHDVKLFAVLFLHHHPKPHIIGAGVGRQDEPRGGAA